MRIIFFIFLLVGLIFQRSPSINFQIELQSINKTINQFSNARGIDIVPVYSRLVFWHSLWALNKTGLGHFQGKVSLPRSRAMELPWSHVWWHHTYLINKSCQLCLVRGWPFNFWWGVWVFLKKILHFYEKKFFRHLGQNKICAEKKSPNPLPLKNQMVDH